MDRFGQGEPVLVVDDAPETRDLLRRRLESAGFTVYTAESVPDAIDGLSRRPIDLVLTDLKMPGMSGIDLVRHIRESYRDTQVVVVTGYPTVETAVEALKSGADDYLGKPFTINDLAVAVKRAFDKRRARLALDQPGEETGRHGLVGSSDAMRSVFRAIERESRGSAPVLVTGEPGTGKQAVARALHAAASRSSEPFVVADVRGMRPERVPGELFGREVEPAAAHAGLFRLAAGGTLFVDGVDDLPAAAQAPLFRVLERAHGARIVTSAITDPTVLVSRGLFDGGLATRLGGVRISLPPLRERPEDLVPLVRRFLDAAVLPDGAGTASLSDRAIEAIRAYNWPGNLDELRIVCRELALRGGTIDLPDLPPPLRQAPARAAALFRTLSEVEVEHIREVLAACDGNRTRAAEVLGIDRKTLREKMKKDL